MLRFILLALVFLAAGCSAGEPAAHADDPIQLPASPVSRCINLGGSLEAPNEGEWGYTVRAADLARIKAAGFDTVRLPVKWTAHAGKQAPYTIDPDFMQRVVDIVKQADETGLQIIVDLHHYDELMDSPEAHYERLSGLWRQISAAFEGAPDSLILELLNEPHDQMTVRRTDAVNRDLLAIVRARHPDRWVILGSAGWGGLDALLKSDPPHDDRIILTFHSYEPYDFTHQGAFFADPPPPVGTRWGTPGDYKVMRSAATRAARFAGKLGHPLFLGEFGVYEDVPLAQRVKWTRAVRETAEARGIGWCYWDYATTFKAYNLERETWINSMLGALTGD